MKYLLVITLLTGCGKHSSNSEIKQNIIVLNTIQNTTTSIEVVEIVQEVIEIKKQELIENKVNPIPAKEIKEKEHTEVKKEDSKENKKTEKKEKHD
jgi:ribosomal protein L12E/L44/L45/RPP1/RPP2